MQKDADKRAGEKALADESQQTDVQPPTYSVGMDATQTGSAAPEDAPLATVLPDGDRYTEAYDFLAPPEAADELGRLGGYRVLKVLGQGGMGLVFEAEDPLLQRRLALKAMKPGLAASASARQRFLREARTAASTEHENIVTIHQVGDDRGIPFIAMPLLRGQTLDERLRHGDGGSKAKGGNPKSPLPLGEVLRIGREIAAGLAAAHENGLIHRDIKPANIWLEAKTGRVKLLDFGLARAADEEQHLTQTGMVLGTPAYMSPEQARGQPVDHRGDLFSLGCVLYQMATGRRPFSGSDTLSTLLAVTVDEPVAPASHNPGLPAALDELICRLLSKSPGDRPQSAQEVMARIAAIAHPAEATASFSTLALGPEDLNREPARADDGPASRSTSSTTIWEGKSLPTSSPILFVKSHPLAISAAAALLLALALATLLGWPPKDESQAPEIEAAVTPAPLTETKPPSLASPAGNIDWSPGPAEGALPGIVPRPARLRGIGRWQIATRVSRGGPISNHALAFSPDGRWLAAVADDGQLRVYDAATRQLECILAGHTAAIRAIAWSPDSEIIATGGCDRQIRLWDLRQRKTADVLSGHTGDIACLAWSREGRLASGGRYGDHCVRIWSREGKPEAVVDYGAPIEAVVWSPDGHLLGVAGLNNGVWLLTAEGTRERVLEANGRSRCIAFSDDGQRLAAGDDGLLRLWDAATWRPLETMQPPRTSTISGLAFIQHGNLLVDTAADGRVNLSNYVTGETIASTKVGNHCASLTWNAGNETLGVSDANGCIRFCHRDLTPAGHELAGTSTIPALRPNGPCCVNLRSLRDSLRIFDFGGRRMHSITELSVGQIAWSPSGESVAAGRYSNPGECTMWDVDDGEAISKWSASVGDGAVCFSPDGTRVATADTDKVVRIWSTEGKRLAESAELPQQIMQMAWRPDGRQLALVDGQAKSIQILDAVGDPSLEPVRTVPLRIQYCRDLMWNRGGTRLLIAGSGKSAVYTLNPDNAEVVVLGSAPSTTLAVAWSPDEQRVASAGSNGTCRLRALDGTPGPILRGHLAPVLDITFVDEGRSVVSAATDCTLIKWDAATGEPLETALLLPNDQFVVFGPGGEVRFATPQADDELIYIVENSSGAQEMFSPQEFRRRLEEAGRATDSAGLPEQALGPDDK